MAVFGLFLKFQHEEGAPLGIVQVPHDDSVVTFQGASSKQIYKRDKRQMEKFSGYFSSTVSKNNK